MTEEECIKALAAQAVDMGKDFEAITYRINGTLVGTFIARPAQGWRFEAAVRAEMRATNEYCAKKRGPRVRDVIDSGGAVDVFIRERGDPKSAYRVECEARPGARITVNGDDYPWEPIEL